jgi:predicted transcriptional regulator
MQTLQELQVWFVLPGIRRELAMTMKQQGISQKRIAVILDLTEAAVSQYLAGKRGADVSFNKEFKTEISLSAERLQKGENLQKELQYLLRKSDELRVACPSCPEKKKNGACGACYH